MSHLDQYFTPGVLEQIIQAEPEDAILTSQPVVQFLSIKAIDAKPAAGGAPAQVERYRIIISDGQNYLQSMLATQLNPLVRDGAVGKQSIVRITQFTVNTVREKRYVTSHTHTQRRD
jgi:replication factor A1